MADELQFLPRPQAAASVIQANYAFCQGKTSSSHLEVRDTREASMKVIHTKI